MATPQPVTEKHGHLHEEEPSMTTEHPLRPRSFLRSPVGLVLLGFLAIAAFFLLTEHTAHVFGALPYVLVLLCPLLHWLLHGRHGGGHAGHGGSHDPEGRAR
jgi:hypothetical protein